MGSTHIPGRPLWSPAPNTASRAECYTELAVDGGVHWRAVGPQSRRHRGFQRSNSGRGSAWLERLVRDQEVGGSNPLAPTNLFNSLHYARKSNICKCESRAKAGTRGNEEIHLRRFETAS